MKKQWSRNLYITKNFSKVIVKIANVNGKTEGKQGEKPCLHFKKGKIKMAINSKQKGARFERHLASRFREYGYTESRRTAQYCGNTGDASDVVGLPMIHAEAKHQEKMELYKWMAQAKRDAKANGLEKMPVVFHKKNNAEILVTMEFDDWMQIYKEFEAGFRLEELKGNGENETD